CRRAVRVVELDGLEPDQPRLAREAALERVRGELVQLLRLALVEARVVVVLATDGSGRHEREGGERQESIQRSGHGIGGPGPARPGAPPATARAEQDNGRVHRSPTPGA